MTDRHSAEYAAAGGGRRPHALARDAAALEHGVGRDLEVVRVDLDRADAEEDLGDGRGRHLRPRPRRLKVRRGAQGGRGGVGGGRW